MTKLTDIAYAAGSQGAGMTTSVKVTPSSVSFYNIEILEVPGPATSVTGYFTAFPIANLKHVPSASWFGFGFNNILNANDTAAFTGLASPWTAGSFEWIIPYNFRLVGAAGGGALITNVTQSFLLEGVPNTGRSTVTKAGASVTRSP